MVELGRLLTAMVTPFDPKGEVDYKQSKYLANELVSSGSDGLVLAGTTGESPTLTFQEKIRLFSEVKQSLGNGNAVIAATGNYSTAESIELTREAELQGVDAIMTVVPYYNRPPQEGMYKHFEAIARSTQLPMILYNVPSRTSSNLEAETVARLSHIPNIVGVKEASGNLDQVAQILRQAKPGFRVWSGNDNDTFGIMALGGYGVVSVASHLVGRQIRGMLESIVGGHIQAAATEHRRLLPLAKGLFITANPIPIKWCINNLGIRVGSVRLPLVDPDPDTIAFLMTLLSQYSVDLLHDQA